MTKLLQTIIQKHIIRSLKCRKLISKDGITTQELTIDKLQGIFESTSINLKSQRIKFVSIGRAASIAKNLDEYQFILCSEIPYMSDSDPIKLQLQKYRIAIIGAFMKLAPLLINLNSNEDIQSWNSFADTLLIEVSEAYVKARSNQKEAERTYNIRLKEALDYFELPEKEIEEELIRMYQNE
ncbi:MAG TPA: hypothetical protein VE076_00235 [Nitrososphaeraceae archaeon]|nr:hypothetical protein [Nitrososphaeraceae archaeon]